LLNNGDRRAFLSEKLLPITPDPVDEFEKHAPTTNPVPVLEFAAVNFDFIDKGATTAVQIPNSNAIAVKDNLCMVAGKAPMPHKDAVVPLPSDGVCTKPQFMNSLVRSFRIVD
jgi:hypothetical protein